MQGVASILAMVVVSTRVEVSRTISSSARGGEPYGVEFAPQGMGVVSTRVEPSDLLTMPPSISARRLHARGAVAERLRKTFKKVVSTRVEVSR